MSLANIGSPTAPMSWLNKGWSNLREYAHNAITHFSQEPQIKEDSQAIQNQVQHQTNDYWGVVSTDIIDHDNHVEIHIEIPGMAKEDIDVVVANGSVVISGEKRMSSTRKEGGCIVTQRAFGRFVKSIPLPFDIKAKEATASYEDGVLTVCLPRGKKSSRRAISIK